MKQTKTEKNLAARLRRQLSTIILKRNADFDFWERHERHNPDKSRLVTFLRVKDIKPYVIWDQETDKELAHGTLEELDAWWEQRTNAQREKRIQELEQELEQELKNLHN